MGSDLQHSLLRDYCRNLLHLLPLDRSTTQQIHAMCGGPTSAASTIFDTNKEQSPTPESMFLQATPAQILYNLEVLHALLTPAIEPLNETNLNFQSAWVHSGCAHFILKLLTIKQFMPNVDMHTKRAAFQNVLRLVKIFLYIVGCILSRVGNEPIDHTGSGRSQTEILKSCLASILGNSEHTIRTISNRLADKLAVEMLSADPEGDACRLLFDTALKWSCPDLKTIKSIVYLAWASGCGALDKLGNCIDFSKENANPDPQDYSLCKEAFEVLSISLVLNPDANESLSRDNVWPKFIISIVLTNPMRQIRASAAEQLYFSCTYCAADWRPFGFIIQLLVDTLETTVPEHAATCGEFFQLLCRALNYGCLCNWPLSVSDVLLTQEFSCLRKVRDVVKETGETQLHEELLEGHLSLTKELMLYLNPDTKSQLTVLIVVSIFY